MPQQNYPITITTTDSVYTVNSPEDVPYLPDSVQKIIKDFTATDSTAYVKEEPAYVTPAYEVSPAFITGALLLLIIIILKAKAALRQIDAERIAAEKAEANETYIPHCLIYKGAEIEFSKAEVHSVCTKYNPFYNKLNAHQQDEFIRRLGEFIYRKNFYIMSSKGYREMPVLIAAAAIQISFGLADFLFPHFSRIIIHPEEYIAYDPLRILVGNVQGRSISISWKHFLDDYLNPTDGKNVGLHEMAHALQVQHIFQQQDFESEFKKDYENYDRIDDEILLAERHTGTTLFDENALSNANEFWATCIELFFEKPQQLQQQYPHLYSSIGTVLNQDTAAM
ncbi:MAG: zinc-dependent peptidase [Rhizobacter sp.]|nr:zinc-dependent peptidase [Ferruginibacter sp.]